MDSDGFAQRWLAPDRGREWDVATVAEVRSDGPGAATLQLELPDPADFVAGQYYLVRIRVEGPPGAVQQAYSLSSSPWPSSPLVEMTVRAVPEGRVSSVLAHRVVAGDQLHLRGPFGSLTWDGSEGEPLVMIGAGSGVAPFTSIVRFASARRSTTPMVLLCSGRDRASTLLRTPLEELNRREDWLSVAHTLTRSPEDPWARFHRRIDAPMIEQVVGELRGWDPTSCSLLVAGPPEMVTSVRAAILTLGVGGDHVVTEIHA